MIARIVEMDEKSRETTVKLQQDKVNSEHEIQKLKKKVKDDYLKRARKRIEANREIEQKKAKDQLKEIEDNYEKVLSVLESVYEENGENLVNEIVSRVLKG